MRICESAEMKAGKSVIEGHMIVESTIPENDESTPEVMGYQLKSILFDRKWVELIRK